MGDDGMVVRGKLGESIVVQSLKRTGLGAVVGWYVSCVWDGYWGPGKCMQAETAQYSGSEQRRRTIATYTQCMCTYSRLLSTPRFEYISPRREDGAWGHGDWNH